MASDESRIEREDRVRVSSRRLERAGVSGRESVSELEARWRKSAWKGAESSLAYYMQVRKQIANPNRTAVRVFYNVQYEPRKIHIITLFYYSYMYNKLTT